MYTSTLTNPGNLTKCLGGGGGGGGGKGQYLSDDGQVFHQREIAELIVVVVSWEVK